MSVLSTGRRPGAGARRLSPEDAYSLPRRPGPAGSKPAARRRPGRPRLHLVPPLPAGPAEDRPAAPSRGRTPVPADVPVPAPRAASVPPAALDQGAPPAAASRARDAACGEAAATAQARLARPGGSPTGMARPGGSPARMARPEGSPARIAHPGGSPARMARPGGSPARIAHPGGSPARIARPAGAAASRGRPRRKVRLTRRGRLVVWVLAVLAAAAALTPVWLIAATGAQAANHGLPPAAVHAGMRHIVVHPGQTLWSIALAAEPAADPRVVTREIMQVNALSSGIVVPGESLWVPGS